MSEERQPLVTSGSNSGHYTSYYTEDSPQGSDALDGGPYQSGHYHTADNNPDTVISFPGYNDDGVKIHGGRNGPEVHYTSADGKMQDSHTEVKRSRSRVSRSISLTQSISGPFEPVTLAFDDINVFVQSTAGCCGRKSYESIPKHILRGEALYGRTIPGQAEKGVLAGLSSLSAVSGVVKPGHLLAIIGASGAGKSTLLNIITSRYREPLIVEGKVTVNGQSVGKAISSISAYVQQDDLFIGILTVKEHLNFRATLGMDRHVTKNQRLARVEKVLQEMGLTKCADTLIGTPGRIKGISGGEMKRLSFASEILTNPALMFCDEPTSGLDSFMAQNIVQTLQTLAAKGRTIICTIHQPSSEVFSMFDQLLILAEGRVAYMGPSKQAIPFFKSQGLTCPSNYNPADFYIHTLAIVNGKEKECRTRVEKICDAYEKSEQAVVIKKDLEEFVSDEHDLGDAWVDMSSIRRYKGSWCLQFSAVFWRSWLGNFRDPNLQKIRLLQNIVIGVILGLVYLRQEYNQESIQNLNGALFLIITNMSFSNMFAVINSFPTELPIFMREHGSRLYRVDVYFISKTIAELPNFIVFPAVFCAVIYWMIGLYEAVEQFFIFLAIMIFVANIAVSVGYVISCMTGSLNIALAVAPPLLIPLMLFGGFYVNSGTVPVYFVWLEYLSWFKYANEIVTINQWKDVTDLACPNNTVGQRPCFTNGQEVLDSLNFSNDNITLDLGLMAALLVGYRLLAFLLLLLRSRKL